MFVFEMSVARANELGLRVFGSNSEDPIPSGTLLLDAQGRAFRFVAIEGDMVWRAYNGAEEWAKMKQRCTDLNRSAK